MRDTPQRKTKTKQLLQGIRGGLDDKVSLLHSKFCPSFCNNGDKEKMVWDKKRQLGGNDRTGIGWGLRWKWEVEVEIDKWKWNNCI